MRLAWKIATRFLLSGRGQTILIAVGIAIGISVQIFIGSLIQGLQKDLVDTTIGSASHVTVQTAPDSEGIPSYGELADRIRQEEPRISAVSPVLDQPGLILRDASSWSVRMRGLDFAAADGIYGLNDRLADGRYPEADGETALGTDLMEELDLAIGDTVDVTVLSGLKSSFTVTGVFDLQVQSLNTTWFLTTQDTLQRLFGQKGLVSSIEMQMEEGSEFEADVVAAALASLPELAGLEVTDWKAQNEQLLSGLNGQSVSSYMIQLFVVVSVVLGIASVLAISVLQKSRQIGILKAMGIPDRQASLVFLLQGFILGVLGGLLGVALGLGLAYSFTVFARNPDGTPVVGLLIQPSFLLLSFALAVVASSLAALVPARRSARLDPIEVIRNG